MRRWYAISRAVPYRRTAQRRVDRRHRNRHMVLSALHAALMSQRVNWGSMPTFAAFSIRSTTNGCCGWWRIGSPIRASKPIREWLRAGIPKSNERHETDRGTPQGAGISPLLANIFLHYALDLWVRQWGRRHASGRVSIVRYADDFVMV